MRSILLTQQLGKKLSLETILGWTFPRSWLSHLPSTSHWHTGCPHWRPEGWLSCQPEAWGMNALTRLCLPLHLQTSSCLQAQAGVFSSKNRAAVLHRSEGQLPHHVLCAWCPLKLCKPVGSPVLETLTSLAPGSTLCHWH